MIGYVVIGRNEGQRLVRCLDSIRHAHCAVYVDSGSTDASVAEAQARGVHVVALDLSVPFTAARARNAGFSELIAKAPATTLVQFVDGDCEVVDGWIEDAVAFMRDNDGVAVVCGRRREISPETSFYNRLCDLEWNTPIGEASACGGDALIRVDAFKGVDGYDARLIAGEEPEMCARLRAQGWKIWRLDADMTLHDAAMHDVRQWWLRGVRTGLGYLQVWRTTRNRPFQLYFREILSSLFWGSAVPVAAVALAILISPLSLVLTLLVYCAQIARIAFRRGVFVRLSWQYGFFMVLAKFAESQGIWRGLRKIRNGSSQSNIFYK